MTRAYVLCFAVVTLFIGSQAASAAQCFMYAGTSYPAAKTIVLSEDVEVDVTFCDGSAGYTSETYLTSPDLQFVGTGHITPSGTQFELGMFEDGTELIFAIYVRNTGNWYYSGPAWRNADGQVHAAVEPSPDGLSWRVGFEDLWGGGDRDYNDINIVITGDLFVVPPGPVDTDEDGIPDYEDNCIFDPNPDQLDSDGDGIGDVCDIQDLDDDGIPDDEDNCVDVFNPDQADLDGDGFGDVCDLCPADPFNDADDDGVCGDVDNCPDTANEDQSDLDGDGLGDLCDDCTDVDGDGVCIEKDLCPDTTEEVPTVSLGTWRWADVNGDGVFETTPSNGKGPKRYYTMEDTAGCSCTQIIDILKLGQGHVKFGCSISAMDDWLEYLNTVEF